LDQRIKEAESKVAPLEERKSVLNQQIETLEMKLAEKSELLKHVGDLEKSGFDIERLRQLQEALTEIGAKQGLKGKEAVSKFFDDLKDYEAILEADLRLKRFQTQIDTKKLEAENWQAREEALRRKHDDLKETIGAIYALRARGVKVNQILAWQRILSRFETVEEFDRYQSEYAEVTGILNARKEEAKSYELRLAQLQSQVETLEKQKAKIEAAIDTLKVAGVKELKALTEATEKQVKAMAAGEIKEAQNVAQEIRTQFGAFFTQLDKLAEKAVHLGEELERTKQELQKYQGIKSVLESHAVATETAK
jgi:chromosome segregation ATPase